MSEDRRPTNTLIAAALALVVVLMGFGAAYVIGTNTQATAAPAPEPVAASPAELGMFVSGTGSATGVPDQLRFAVTINHTAADVTEAMDATSADTRRVVRTLIARGVERKDIRTANVSVQPRYRYSGGQELITGYSASEKVSVKVRDIKIAGEVISATANSAGNAVRIGGISMSVADPSALQEQARTAAIADARTKAEQFAEAAGRTLGDVVVVEEFSPAEPGWSRSRGYEDLDARVVAAKVPINPGTGTTQVHVQVRWSFS